MAAMVDSALSLNAPVPLRILFLGLPGVLAEVALDGLLARQAEIAAVVVPQQSVPQFVPAVRQALIPVPPPLGPGLVLAGPQPVRGLPLIAWEAGVPLLAATQLGSPEMVQELRAIAADVAVVACYTQRIPRSVLEIPRHGFLNIHPSLLPAYRGPAPLFWQFRDGAAPFGVTIHFMNEQLDAGDIAAQAEVEIPDGATGPEADALLALSGTALLARVLSQLAAGTLLRYPQTGSVSHAPWPAESEFTVPASWTARRAFNFIRGTEEWGRPFHIVTAGDRLTVTAVTGYEDEARMDEPFRVDGDRLCIRMGRGVLQAVGYREEWA